MNDQTALAKKCELLKEINSDVRILNLLTGDDQMESMPEVVVFNITSNCNLACPHCYPHSTPENRRISNKYKPDMDLFFSLAREALPFANYYTVTRLGEPLLVRNLEEIISNLNRYGAKLRITTNGVLLNKNKLIAILPNLAAITISMDGATEYVFEKLRKNANYRSVINNVRLLTMTLEKLSLKEKVTVMINFTLMRSNLYELPLMVHLAKALDVKFIQVCPIVTKDSKISGEDLSFHEKEVASVLEEARECARENDVFLRLELHERADSNNPINSSIMEKLIVKNLPADYYETQKPILDYLDLEALENTSSEIMDALEKESEFSGKEEVEKENKYIDDLLIRFKKFKKNTVENGHDILSQLSTSGQRSRYCDQLENQLYVLEDGNTGSCCIQGRPNLGSTYDQNIHEIWNGDKRKSFYEQFHSENQPKVCVGCSFNKLVETKSLLVKARV